MYNHLINFIDANKILYQYQFGFHKSKLYLINSSFESVTFPEELKLAKVIPIFKSGDNQDISNYRPISILSFFSTFF